MKKQTSSPLSCGASLLLSAALSPLLIAPAMASHSVKEGLKIQDLPPPAQKAVTEEINKGATLGVIHAITEEKDGKTWFLARFVMNGHGKELNFDPKGKITSIDEEVPLESLPAVVLAAVHKSIPADAKVRMVEAENEADGDVSYVVRMSEPPKALTFDKKGKIVKTVSKVVLESLPAAVRDGIQKSVGKGVLVHGNELEAITENGGTTYAVDVRNDGVRSKLYVDDKGNHVK